jgi:hypothetical protein
MSPGINSCGSAYTTGTIKSFADYTTLKAYASFTATNETAQVVDAVAHAHAFATLALSSTGSPSTIDFNFTLTGNGLSGNTALLDLSASSNVGAPAHFTTYTTNPTTYTYTVNWASTIFLDIDLKAEAKYDNGTPGPWSGSATSDFYSTAVLQSIVFYDSLHNDVSNTVTLEGPAGANYQLGLPSGVPEPSTLALTALAGAVFAAFRKRARA